MGVITAKKITQALSSSFTFSSIIQHSSAIFGMG